MTGGGIDYEGGPYTVTISAGETSSSLNISINDDNILEENETFVLNISLHDNCVVLGSPSETTVTIVANDGKVIYRHFKHVIYKQNAVVL